MSTTNNPKPPSPDSTASSTTLTNKLPNPLDPQTQPSTSNTTSDNGTLTQYIYTERVGPPNLDAQPKKKSKLSKFLSTFQSSAVQQTNAAREREKLEEQRTGVRKTAAMGAPQGTGQSFGAFV
ncbi:uncharacterized protein C8A04DRAFT_30648 [Dichotomopilus funicola]|uniref:Uncharacterized protein n=1 Tax=Dichotomopilus funicola TaxID=1934379 RepID=A0AAN6ZL20_9PEZI|nr:hypothetical protein C8A04DRAFT_30648 [Dichotomopilus funicola]